MTIHAEHPFAPDPGDRDPLRRLRGRMPAPVTVWAHGTGRGRAGLTVSSLIVAAGEPPQVLGVVDEDSAFWDDEPEVFTIGLLTAGQEYLADAFAGQAPAPGGAFTLGTWTDSAWGPVLEGTAGWFGVRRAADSTAPRHVGWGLLVEAVVEHVALGTDDVVALTHVRGRYRVSD